MRYDELDSLRGLAALTVLTGHCLVLLPYFGSGYDPNLPLLNLLRFTPLSIIWAGHEAVILFFILSGFVLSLPFYNNKEQPYITYLIKRIFRIYIPYAAAITAAIAVRIWVSNRPGLDLNKWLYTLWDEKVTWSSIIQHFLFLGNYNSRVFDPVAWSLIEEMRISIIFPALILVVLRYNWKVSLAVGLACALVSNLLNYIKWHYPFPFLPTIMGIFSTLEWIPMFIFGALLAKHIEKVFKIFQSLIPVLKALIFTLGVLAYTFDHWLQEKGDILQQQIISDWSISAGAVVFIVFAVSSKAASRFLLFKPIHYCGKISFSVYLYHMIILIGLVHAYYGTLPLWLIWLITIGSTFIVATLSYYFIEVPSITLGKKLISGIPKINRIQPGYKGEGTSTKV